MPNHVDNRLIINGSEAELNRFVTATHEGDCQYNFNKLVPLDPRASKKVHFINDEGVEQAFGAFAEGDTDGFDGYQNALDVWGSKWGAYDIQEGQTYTHETFGDGTCSQITFNYNSAWGPAGELIRRISAQFPTLSFGTWFTEEGNGFAGWELYINAELVSEGSADMSTLPELDWDNDSEPDLDKYNDAYDAIYELCESRLEEATNEHMVKQE
jgi:hypothetical protein